MFLRVFFVIRTIMTYSEYNEQNAKRIAKKYKVKSGTSFSIKALMTKKPRANNSYSGSYFNTVAFILAQDLRKVRFNYN